MKRARVDEDFNPVYPYDSPNAPLLPFITPPFTSPDGLQEKPFGVLSLKYINPITTQNGSLTLKLGSGLSINNQGELTSRDYEVHPPITKTNDALGLAYSNPLVLNTDKQLTLIVDAPLTTASGALRLKSAAPLGIADNTLRVLFSNPLYLNNNFLTLAIERPLALASSGAVALEFTAPLQMTAAGLSVSTANPLTISNGNLSLAIKRPLILDDNSLYLDFRAPLRLFNSDPVLGVNCDPPLTVKNESLALTVGRGLTLAYDGLILNLGRDLAFQNGTVAVSLNPEMPLQYTDRLRLSIGAGLRYNPVSRKLDVDLNTDKGLTWEDNKVVTKLGQGLYFDSTGSIALSPVPTKPDTLWTTADPSPNCTVYDQLDARLWLALVKCGNMVHGTVALKPEKGTLLKPTASFISIVIYFYSNGVRRTDYPTFDDEGTLANSATWGYRQGQSADTNVTNAVEFMPSRYRYPIENGDKIQNQMCGYTCMQGDFSMPVPFKVTFNHAFQGYSLKFTWRVVNNQPFAIPCCSFSYITEE
ncbi:fiber-2 [Simian adenovirus 19]|uniref:Fiber-2 n=1 Tax=Simian adenovirus 19 TaxID=38416 RepID=A0A0M5LB44_9ADEN|nr:fiber-2 [Simian adenovirus 19]ALE30448.1 fiber-2 [Simian adenovirus 19]